MENLRASEERANGLFKLLVVAEDTYSSHMQTVTAKAMRYQAEIINFTSAVTKRSTVRLSIGSSMIIDGVRNPDLGRKLDEIISGLQLVSKPVTETQVTITREAFRRYGNDFSQASIVPGS